MLPRDDLDGRRPGLPFDFVLIGSAACLVAVGLLSLFSIDHDRDTNHFPRQAVFAALGCVVALVGFALRTDTWRRFSWALYVASLGALAAVLVAGKGQGAQRWLDIGFMQFQPSELSKIALVLTLAAFFDSRWNQTDRLETYLLSLAISVPPMAMVFLQPHLGATLAHGMIWLAAILAARVPARYVLTTLVLVAVMAVAAVTVPGILLDYQRERLVAMVRPDPDANNYQVQQALIAFGSGGVTGRGFLQGERKAAGYVPEQENDFVFTVVGEEGGLVACAVVVGLFAVFYGRLWLIGQGTRDAFIKIASNGILAVLAFHTLVNLGMNVGILPVVGLWLPFISAGGTALLLCAFCVGIAARMSWEGQSTFFRPQIDSPKESSASPSRLY